MTHIAPNTEDNRKVTHGGCVIPGGRSPRVASVLLVTAVSAVAAGTAYANSGAYKNGYMAAGAVACASRTNCSEENYNGSVSTSRLDVYSGPNGYNEGVYEQNLGDVLKAYETGHTGTLFIGYNSAVTAECGNTGVDTHRAICSAEPLSGF